MHALIDPGSTHSYMCTDIPSLVTNQLEYSVIVNKVYRDRPNRIREYEFLGELIELSFREFNVILGMDWLS